MDVSEDQNWRSEENILLRAPQGRRNEAKWMPVLTAGKLKLTECVRPSLKRSVADS